VAHARRRSAQARRQRGPARHDGHGEECHRDDRTDHGGPVLVAGGQDRRHQRRDADEDRGPAHEPPDGATGDHPPSADDADDHTGQTQHDVPAVAGEEQRDGDHETDAGDERHDREQAGAGRDHAGRRARLRHEIPARSLPVHFGPAL